MGGSHPGTPPPIHWITRYFEAVFTCLCGERLCTHGDSKRACWTRVMAAGWSEAKGGRPTCPACTDEEGGTDGA